MVADIRRVKMFKHPEMISTHFTLLYCILSSVVCNIHAANIPPFEVKNDGAKVQQVPNQQFQANMGNPQAQVNFQPGGGAAGGANNLPNNQAFRNPNIMGNMNMQGQQVDNHPNVIPGGQGGQPQRPVGGRKNILLATHPDCKEDVETLCNTDNLRKNNFAVLDCLQADLDIQVGSTCCILIFFNFTFILNT